ncbi:MAG: sigma-54-dependent Fis family transcriptional regulator [Gammaproteobacteria bacterium]|nr:MAG: sigma-54-dependent Fis family transcriptional regulator [Gammaproteobacteria bacterium]
MTAGRILLVEDDLALREALAETLELAGYEASVATDGEAALAELRRVPVDAVVTDYQMQPMDGSALLRALRRDHPQLPVLLMTAHGSIQHAVSSMLEGATDYLVKPFSAQLLIDKLSALLPPEAATEQPVAADPLTRRVLEIARKVASADSTVLLTGESGTGKEVFARYIHAHSARADGPFVAINCAAIPENMLEAVLFGHEKGAFTGAHESRAGKFEQANGGSLLLDEISEMDLALQAKLLRVIQEKEVERLGGKRSIRLDLRLLATTNRDLAAEVAAGRFREDLYYRLSVFPIELPALRQRRGDIPALARYFIAEARGADARPVVLDGEAEAALLAHDWPGNARELQNVIQRALILCSGHRIRRRDLQLPDPVATPTAAAPKAAEPRLQDSLQSVEGQLILDALAQGRGSRKRAAEILGISPRTLRYKIARLRAAGIPIPAPHETAAA